MTPEGRRSGPGLRLQILLALAGIIVVAYVLLFFAIAQVMRGTALADREENARSLGRAIAAHLATVRASDRAAVERTIASHVGSGGAIAIAIFGADGEVLASGGAASLLHSPARPYGESAARVALASGRALDVVLPSGDDAAIVVRMAADDDPARTSQLVRGIALYMSVFALALLFFAYIALTRAIVRPIEQLARAADRVASGAKGLELPAAGAREVAELGASVRAMAARLLRDEQTLRAKIDELTTTTRRLGETREQLAGSEHMASVGKLAAGVAHEIGNPIAAIMGMHDLLEDEAGTSAETRADFLRRMRKETERINVVVRDLLDYARPESAPASIRQASAEVAVVVDDAMSLVRPQKDFKGVTLDAELEPGLWMPLGPQRLTQVLLNLLLNAGAATAQSVGDRRIVVRSKASDGLVRLEVEDNGPGVPADMARRIFDPFVTTKDVGAGTGLGLAVCKGIVEGAKGRIFVERGEAGGARFVIELPPPAIDARTEAGAPSASDEER